MDRVATFQSFIARSPRDPFPRYGLAMELRARGDLPAAWQAFETLLAEFPAYVPAYLMAGQTLVALGRRDDAADVFRTGIEHASQIGNAHARGELEGALAEL
ncbi:MAG: tetratricopeptide repeat protein [Myxococcales bacterium]|jgi:tetratricopeptide (TPR) repeat protein|nr:tetratricopeptide repeat protein [Myxococcales bacterium]HRC55108.1 tetratricopeptide repeat protein [Kofleriaceae bacterium]